MQVKFIKVFMFVFFYFVFKGVMEIFLCAFFENFTLQLQGLKLGPYACLSHALPLTCSPTHSLKITKALTVRCIINYAFVFIKL